MDRRGFLQKLVGGVVAGAAIRTWPFRVYSFPTEIVQPPIVWDISIEHTDWLMVRNHMLDHIAQQFREDVTRLVSEKREVQRWVENRDAWYGKIPT